MAKEIVIWCEVELRESDLRVPAREHEISLDGTVRTMDLCDDCFAKHFAPLLTLLDEYGEVVSKKRGPYKTKKKAAAAASTGSSAPKAAVTPNADGEYECDHPGCERVFSRPQALGRHKVSHEAA